MMNGVRKWCKVHDPQELSLNFDIFSPGFCESVLKKKKILNCMVINTQIVIISETDIR